MKFSTLLFAFSAITGAIAADSNTQNQVTSPDTIPNSRTTSHASPRTATWRLYNRVYRPPQVRTVSLSESQKQSRGSDNDTTSNSQLSSRSSSLSGSWRVFMRTPRRSVAKIISLEEAKRQVEGGSTKVESSSKVESRSVDTSIANDVVKQKEEGKTLVSQEIPWGYFVGRMARRGRTVSEEGQWGREDSWQDGGSARSRAKNMN
jgi:hypothetical protein